MNSLPLSWSIINEPFSQSKIIRSWDFDWLAINALSSSNAFNISDYQKSTNKKVIIRGCNDDLKSNLENEGFSSLLVGYEAILDLNRSPFIKKSLKELVKRGNRFGKVTKVPFSIENKLKLEQFQKITSHGNEPQLKNLFQMSFEKNHFLYAFVDKANKWLGAVLLSQNSITKLHTELLLRKKNAPNGVMESLIEYIFVESKRNGFEFLSLGEVPFNKKIYQNGDLRSKILHHIGNFLSFSYNHKGLYNFKNKFDPSWNKIFICSSKKVNFKHLFIILIHSNFHKLIVHNLIYSIKKIFYSFFHSNGKKLVKST